MNKFIILTFQHGEGPASNEVNFIRDFWDFHVVYGICSVIRRNIRRFLFKYEISLYCGPAPRNTEHGKFKVACPLVPMGLDTPLLLSNGSLKCRELKIYNRWTLVCSLNMHVNFDPALHNNTIDYRTSVL